MHNIVNFFIACSIFVLIGASQGLRAQVMPVGTHVLEDKLRRDQLLGLVDSSISFSVRPLTNRAILRSDLYLNTSNNATENSSSPTSIRHFANGDRKSTRLNSSHVKIS